jgi:hypothetical protein
MFIHRKIDKIKPRGSWVSSLRQNTVYFVEKAAPHSFSSSGSSELIEKIRQCILTAILPSLFEVATSYEDHIVQQGPFEGSRKRDPRTGKQHTWQAISRPAGKPLARKRARGNRVYERELTDCDGSAEESSPGDSSSDKPKAASPTVQLETSSPRAPTGASKQVVASNGSHASIERQQGPPSQSSLATTASSPNHSKGQAFQTDSLISTLDIKKAIERTPAQTQSSYEIPPHGSHLAYDGFGTDFEGSTTQPVGWCGSEVSYSMGGLPYFPGNWNPCLIYSQYHVIDGYGCEPGTCYGLFDGSTYTSLEPC